MKTFIDNAREFRARIANQPQQREELARLAAGQSPLALFITCSDSRVIPSLITGARPGDLFELRTAGNAVPGYGEGKSASAEAATIEYAVCVLGVADIIVCGHSHCGAIRAKVRGEDLTAVPAVRDWLAEQLPHQDDLPDHDGPSVAAAVQRNVREQLRRLRAYPCVGERLKKGALNLHGWFYEIHTGLVLAHQSSVDAFLPL